MYKGMNKKRRTEYGPPTRAQERIVQVEFRARYIEILFVLGHIIDMVATYDFSTP